MNYSCEGSLECPIFGSILHVFLEAFLEYSYHGYDYKCTPNMEKTLSTVEQINFNTLTLCQGIVANSGWDISGLLL